jgi:5'-nucleotidase
MGEQKIMHRSILSSFYVSLLVSVVASLSACGGGTSGPPAPVNVKIIAMNDFHGNFEIPAATNGGAVVVKDPANTAGTSVRTGGAAFLATMIKQLRAKNPNNILVGAGDMVGAAPVTATLTHDESTVDILNQIGLALTSVGNHEFDKGKTELLRIQNGGCFVGGVVGQDTCLQSGAYPGASFKYLAANVVDQASGQPLFPATSMQTIGGVKIGFIGLTFKDTPSAVTASGVAGLRFLDEASTINTNAALLRSQGANAVVVLIHQGGQTTASTLNDQACPGLSGEILPIVDALTRDVDIVISGHTHQEYVCSRNGKLLTQTGFYGSVVTEIDLVIDPSAGVKSMTANNIPVINDQNTTLPAGYAPLAKDTAIDSAVQRYIGLSATLSQTVVGTITADIKRALLSGSTATRDEGTEGAMGDVMADIYLEGGPPADIAFINPGGVRSDLTFKNGGQVTFGDLLTVAPFSNKLVGVDLTGAQLLRLLEQQWEAPNCAAKANTPGGANGCGRMLQPSKGLAYTWDFSRAANLPVGQGSRVLPGTVKISGESLDINKTYRVIFNSFNAPGPGDNFDVVTAGRNIVNSGITDIDAFVAYMRAHPRLAPPAPRITRIN